MNVRQRTARGLSVLILVAALVGGFGESRSYAFNFTNGDLIVAFWNNTTEWIQNLGTANSLLAPNTSTPFNVSAAVAAAGGANPVHFTLLTWDAVNAGIGQYSIGASANQPLPFVGTVSTVPAFNALTAWNFQVSAPGFQSANPGNSIAASDPNSFTSIFGTFDRLQGSYPVPMSGVLGSTVYLTRDSDVYGAAGPPNQLSPIGTALLSADGTTLTVCGNGSGACALAPVPLPAAVILFGSGLVGLAGIARRSVGGVNQREV